MDFHAIWEQIRDNWLLIWMGTFFVAVIIWAYRPGSRAIDADIANIPFRHEDKPVDPSQPKEPQP
ncbi:cbb3-type cytochrome c oxidase subunit 3 [Yoonia sp.]|uniref:cbb3-type cytochrome c oxidase subunit 3 n=1 Tax=Yoonia sp. TaxID=2212373 RepID=UPI00391DECF6